jgi:hypothetical protein
VGEGRWWRLSRWLTYALSEITDALVDLLIGLMHKVNATAERRVEKTLTDDLKRVRGKAGNPVPTRCGGGRPA